MNEPLREESRQGWRSYDKIKIDHRTRRSGLLAAIARAARHRTNDNNHTRRSGLLAAIPCANHRTELNRRTRRSGLLAAIHPQSLLKHLSQI